MDETGTSETQKRPSKRGILACALAFGIAVTLMACSSPVSPEPAAAEGESHSGEASESIGGEEADSLRYFEASEYPDEVGGLIKGDAIGLPTYDEWGEGSELVTSLMPGDLGGPWRTPYSAVLEDEGVSTRVEVLPGIWCHDGIESGNPTCDTFTKTGRRWDVQQTEGKWSYEQLAQWLSDFVAQMPEQ